MQISFYKIFILIVSSDQLWLANTQVLITGLHNSLNSPGTGESRRNILADRKWNISLNSAIHRNAHTKLFTFWVLTAQTNNDSYLLINVMPFAGSLNLWLIKFGLNARIYDELYLSRNWIDFILKAFKTNLQKSTGCLTFRRLMSTIVDVPQG